MSDEKRVLVVEDHPANLRLLMELLEMRGIAAHGVRQGDEAVAAARRFKPHLVLMDLQLPGMDGLEATRQLKADPATARVPVVAVTANALGIEEQRARSAGCDGFLSKPVDMPELFGVLDRYLG